MVSMECWWATCSGVLGIEVTPESGFAHSLSDRKQKKFAHNYSMSTKLCSELLLH